MTAKSAIDFQTASLLVRSKRMEQSSEINAHDLLDLGKQILSALKATGEDETDEDAEKSGNVEEAAIWFLIMANRSQESAVLDLASLVAEMVPDGEDILFGPESETLDRSWLEICLPAGVSPLVWKYVEDFGAIHDHLNDCESPRIALEVIFDEVTEKSEHMLELVRETLMTPESDWQVVLEAYVNRIKLLRAYRPFPWKIAEAHIPHNIRDTVERIATENGLRRLDTEWGSAMVGRLF